jgi:hypothetical protein
MMKKLLYILLFIPFALQAQTTYYVAAAGGNNGNPGTSGSPWATLAYAVTQVSATDTIYMQAGTHNLASGVDLPVGVSLRGVDSTNSVIHSTISTDYSWAINLYSASNNTAGNQTVKNLKFTGIGDNPASGEGNITGAIAITNRGSVTIRNCSFRDFDDNAVNFRGDVTAGDGHEADHWCTNNRFYDNIIVNCSKQQGYPNGWMSGSLQIGAQSGMRIYNNYIQENTRAVNNCGYPIKYVDGGYNKDLRIYDNTIIKRPAGTNWNDWNFAIELWFYRGGVRIYDNHIEGSIDIDHVQRNGYDTALVVRDNAFGYSSLPTSSGDWTNLNAGVYIEFGCENIYIHSNTFTNLESPFRFSPRDESVNKVWIYNNIINQIGNVASDAGCNLMNFAGDGYSIDSLFFVNNTVYAGSNGEQYGLIIPEEIFTYLRIENNTFQGFGTRPIEITGTNINQLSIQNNIFYGNGTNSANVTGSPSNYTNANNLTSIPGYVTPGSNFTLTESANARGAGKTNTWNTVDFAGSSWLNPPSIGAYEYGSSPPEEPDEPTVTTNITKELGKFVKQNGKIIK